MDKKYQVFVSSTYKNLEEERKNVTQMLLELDCIPIGMELFPASDDDQWTFIKSIIDDCDYYILILGGRYGSCSKSGVSYTEMEYRYAQEQGKPIIAFLHRNLDNIPTGKTDKNQKLKKKLDTFYKLAGQKLCKYWTSASDLTGVVATSIVALKKRSPAIGWVKADKVPSDSDVQEILRLRKEIDSLKAQIGEMSTAAPEGVEDLCQGNDLFDLKFELGTDGYEVEEATLQASYNKIFQLISSDIYKEVEESKLFELMCNYISENYSSINDYDVEYCTLKDICFDSLMLQFRTLGLIKDSVSSQRVTWSLTKRGEALMVQLLTQRREVK